MKEIKLTDDEMLTIEIALMSELGKEMFIIDADNKSKEELIETMNRRNKIIHVLKLLEYIKR